jgi:hypothetical protein
VRVFENGVLKRIFVSKRDEIIGGWKIFHVMSFITFNIIRMIKPKKMG